ATTGGEPVLTIRLRRRALLATKRRFEAMLKSLAGPRPGSGKFGLTLDEGWEKAPKDRRLVVLIHGLHSSPERIDDIIPDLHARKLPVGVFRYPNDQGLDESARLLAAELAEIARAQPERPVSLVTHSMGGLVARAVVEDPGLDPGNVRQLIMAAPPSHGSRLADFAWALELGEFVADARQRVLLRSFQARLEDGMGEAGDDLRPGSAFLRRLNARPRNPRVVYSLLLGTKAHLTEKELVRMRETVAAEGKKNRFVRFFGPKLDALLADLDEVVDGKGDGAVALKRGKLEGVTDVVLIPVRHGKAWDDLKDPGSAALRKAVLERLERK
ncbi:MAG: alpha/beta fold hydrolase, partial [Planctomycetota bacterium]